MKKIWKDKEDEGVSPVIATILMVAITVVLAAVLYVMVMNIRPPQELPPVGSLGFDVRSGTEVLIDFVSLTPPPAPTELKVIITNSSDPTDKIELTFSGPPDSSSVDMVATGGATAVYSDLNYNSNTVNPGDSILVGNLGPHTSYSVEIYHYPTDSVCSLVGTATFNLA